MTTAYVTTELEYNVFPSPHFHLSIQLSQANQPFRLNEQLLLWFLLQLWIEEPQLFRHLLANSVTVTFV